MNIRTNEEVRLALEEGRPVVALESTIISHGMPYPRNVETALNVERIIRENGAVPATVGIIDGVGVVGMTEDEIEEFGKRGGIAKVSRRDLPIIVAKKAWGATTVATTMILANMAGVEIFVTGGIGGVHRGATETMDISADLQELAHTNVSVICAGAKAILDIPLTLEYLETFGVPVLGYQTDDFPAFYTRSSGVKVEYRADSPLEVAEIIKAKREMKLDGGVLIGNPIPEEDSLDPQIMNAAIDKALACAKKDGIKGKEVTPYLLAKVKDITNDSSLDSNIKLVYNNARLGAQIACELCKNR
ncbi:MAG: pseudouridine-5'-phosphate glycosidase [Erysipelotrichaceae bacterium]|nr:pseudouridine-5'-phosphate glycosidase [Erysipelotrichaceae bacterium]